MNWPVWIKQTSFWRSFLFKIFKVLAALPILFFLFAEGYEIVGDILYSIGFADERPSISVERVLCHKDIVVNVSLSSIMFGLFLWALVIVIRAKTYLTVIIPPIASWLLMEFYVLLRIDQTVFLPKLFSVRDQAISFCQFLSG